MKKLVLHVASCGLVTAPVSCMPRGSPRAGCKGSPESVSGLNG